MCKAAQKNRPFVFNGGTVSLESIVVLDNIERVANNGVWFNGQGDRKGRQQIAGIDHLKTTVYIDDAPYLVDIRVRLVEQVQGQGVENVLYYFTPEEIMTIERVGTESPTGERRALTGGSETMPTLNDSIPQTPPGVNPDGGIATVPRNKTVMTAAEARALYQPFIEAYAKEQFQAKLMKDAKPLVERILQAREDALAERTKAEYAEGFADYEAGQAQNRARTHLHQNEEHSGVTMSIKETFTGDKKGATIKAREAPGAIAMPNYAKAVTPVEKFIRYSLDYENPKASGKPEAYERGLGYTKENAEELIAQIHTAVTSGKVKAFEVQETEYGVKYRYRIAITGPNGKTKNVIVVYQIDHGETIPRMITNYLEGK